MSFWKIRKEPITFPITSEEANARNQEVIVAEMLKEHERAEELVKRVNDYNNIINGLKDELKTKPPEGTTETDKEAKARLEKVINTLSTKIGKVLIKQAELKVVEKMKIVMKLNLI